MFLSTTLLLAGKKGGQIVSQNREHMSEIGRRIEEGHGVKDLW